MYYQNGTDSYPDMQHCEIKEKDPFIFIMCTDAFCTRVKYTRGPSTCNVVSLRSINSESAFLGA